MFALTGGDEGRLVSPNPGLFSLVALGRLATIYGCACWSEMKERGIYDTVTEESPDALGSPGEGCKPYVHFSGAKLLRNSDQFLLPFCI